MASSTGLLEFAERYPDRFFDVGIAEQHAVTFASGLAMKGLRPVVCIYSSFLQRAFDQIACDACLHRLPVTFVIDRAGITGDDGPSHHGMLDLAYLRCIPNLVVAAPSSPDEMRRMLATALAHDGPFALRYPRGSAPATATAPLEPLTIGRSITRRAGRATSPSSRWARWSGWPSRPRASSRRTGSAPPSSTPASSSRSTPTSPTSPRPTGRSSRSRTAPAWAASGAPSPSCSGTPGWRCRCAGLGIPDRFVEHGAQALLLSELGLDADGVARSARELLASRAARPRPHLSAAHRGRAMGTVLVTVAGPGGQVDLALPDDAPVGAIVPALVRHCEPEPRPWSRWALGLPGGEPFPPRQTLGALGVARRRRAGAA